MAKFQPAPSGLWTPRQTGLVAGRYQLAYQNTPEHLREMGKQALKEIRALRAKAEGGHGR